MADLDDLREGIAFRAGVGAATATNGALKGVSGHDWGIRSRMGRIFNATSGRTDGGAIG